MTTPEVSKKIISHLCYDDVRLLARNHHGLYECSLAELNDVLDTVEKLGFSIGQWIGRHNGAFNPDVLNNGTLEDIFTEAVEHFEIRLSKPREWPIKYAGAPHKGNNFSSPDRISLDPDMLDAYFAAQPYGTYQSLKDRLASVPEKVVDRIRVDLAQPTNTYYAKNQYENRARDEENGKTHLVIMPFQPTRPTHRSGPKYKQEVEAVAKRYTAEIARMLKSYSKG